ncbi:hypothetical protein [Mucilaginibacter sp.]|uniref:hypothetical protein n=1 Tax=Mucilaginibacter sp. TaxID=1882438 RepID=UPI00374D5FE3
MKVKNIISRIVMIVLCLPVSLSAIACDACKKQQPKLLQGITHGGGPDSNWDYLIVSAMVIITLYSLYATIKCVVKPKDKNHQDIKNIIFN